MDFSEFAEIIEQVIGHDEELAQKFIESFKEKESE